MASAAPTELTIRLLEHDPDLGRSLRPERLEEARRCALATALMLAPGARDVDALAGGCPYGLLLLGGVLSREATLAGTASMQLLGRNDLVAPRGYAGDRLVPVEVRWRVLEPAAVALLDARFLLTIRRWPELVAALFERLGVQAERLGTQRALCQLPRVEDRVHALLCFLAERWGRVTPLGVVVPVRLTHDALGRLVGAKRPTVSLAVKTLDERGLVHRRPDGGWLLAQSWAGTVTPPDAPPAATAAVTAGREPALARRAAGAAPRGRRRHPQAAGRRSLG